MADEKVLSSDILYRGRVVTLRVDTISRGGDSTYKREIVEHGGAVAIVPLDQEGNVYLVRQYRSGSAREMLEIPAGGLEPGEPPLECARRELQEEINMYPENLIELGSFYVAASYTTERITIYLTNNMRPSSQQGDPDEDIAILRMPFADALRMALANEIEDSKTIIGLLWAARYLGFQPF